MASQVLSDTAVIIPKKFSEKVFILPKISQKIHFYICYFSYTVRTNDHYYED